MAQAIPGLNYGDALRRAVQIIRGESNGNLQPQITTARPAINTQYTNNSQQRAAAAAASVRGRTASGLSSGSMPSKIPMDVHDTVKMALDNLRKGVS
jgi:hypothetical protein